MADFDLTPEEGQRVDALVAHYRDNSAPIKRFLDSLHIHISDSASLSTLTHSVKRRMKSEASLRDKLGRKIVKAHKAGVEFGITPENLFTEVTDLAGYRILHLHTRQMESLNAALLHVLDEAQSTVIEGPKANVWDQETEAYFKGIGINTEYNPRLYSSVHYLVRPNKSKVNVTVEIQVRTLSEEVWGEVDHRFNYPHPIDSVACGEQIKVLARVASSCTRLVDSIFASHADLAVDKKQAEVIAAEPAPDDKPLLG